MVDTKENCKLFDILGPYCHDCGIKIGAGLNHHVGCDMEICPIPGCKRQLISCTDHLSQEHITFYRELPKYATPKRITKSTLQKFIDR